MYDVIVKLCKMNNISIRTLESSLGLANGTVRKWNTCNPGVKQVVMVADFFGVPLEVLMGRDSVSAIRQYPELELAVRQLNPEGVQMLTAVATGLVAQPQYKKSHIASTLEREA